MSRTIKFRAWDKRINQMKPVANISFGHDGSAVTIMAELAPKEKYYNAIIHEESGILMQFTGLKDEKGKEIYEGDIIKLTGAFDEQIAQVFWGRSHDSYTWVTGETWLIRILKGHVVGSEGSLLPYCEHRHGFWVHIIGNIYENPELVETRG